MWQPDGPAGRRSGARSLLNALIVILAVIGALAVAGWVLSTVLWLIRLAAVIIAVAVVLVLLKVAVRRRGNRG